MKLTDKAQKTLDALFASGDGKITAGGVVFGTIVIYKAGRAAGMKYREIQETFMTDGLRVGYGKYDLQSLRATATHIIAPRSVAAKKAATKGKKVAAQKPLTQKEKHKKMLEDSKNWEVVYCAETERALEESEKMFK